MDPVSKKEVVKFARDAVNNMKKNKLKRIKDEPEHHKVIRLQQKRMQDIWSFIYKAVKEYDDVGK